MDNTKLWLWPLALIVVGGVGFEIHRLHKAQEADRLKLQEEAARIEQLNKSVQIEDQKLSAELAEENHRKAIIGNSILDKQKQIQNLQQQISQLSDPAEVAKKKALAEEYLRKEKSRVANIQDQIKTFEDQKKNEQSSSQNAQISNDYNYHQQENQLAERLKIENQTLSQLNTQLAQMHVDKRNPESVEGYNTKKQAIEIQRSVIANIKQQRDDLGRQHTLSRDSINIEKTKDNSGLDSALASLRQDLATEKTYYDQADKAVREINQAGTSNDAKIRDLRAKIQILQTEIRDLQNAK